MENDIALSKKDRSLCRDIKDSIGNIVRYSLNEDFRNDCFRSANVDCTYQLEEFVFKKLKDVCMGKLTPRLNSKPIFVVDTPGKEDPQENMSRTIRSTRTNYRTPLSQVMSNPNKNWLEVTKQTRLTKRKSEPMNQGSAKISYRPQTFCSEGHINRSRPTFGTDLSVNFTPNKFFFYESRPTQLNSFSQTFNVENSQVDHVRRALFSQDNEVDH